MVTEILSGWGGSQKPNFSKKSIQLKLEFSEGWSGGGEKGGGTQPKEPSMGKVWVFSGITLTKPFCGSY